MTVKSKLNLKYLIVEGKKNRCDTNLIVRLELDLLFTG